MSNVLHFQPPGGGQRIAIAGDIYTELATGEQTGGAYTLYYAEIPPGGGPPFHIHHREDEAFYVLEGEMTYFTQGQEIVASPGAMIHLPRNIAHRFQNRGEKLARMLIQVTPAGVEHYFRKAGYIVTDPDDIPDTLSPEAIQRLIEHSAEFGLEILPPPAH
jgi:quercetin dioxygenase-like cupin family protein